MNVTSSLVERRDPLIIPALREHPSRLYVETTSRCNLNCVMCMKQNAGGGRADGDLEVATFEALEEVFPRLEALVLNGVGEPLLNSRLESLIGRAKKIMPEQGWVGFQTNGILLTNIRAMALVDAGLDRICFSMDGVSPTTFKKIRAGGKLLDLEWAFSAIVSAKKGCFRPDLQIGVEYVLMRENMRELPAALRWASDRGANFAIVSHALPYDELHASRCAYDLCSAEAHALYHVWKEKADLAGVKIDRYFDILWKFRRSSDEQRIVDFVEGMKADAQQSGITLDLKRLFSMNYSRLDQLAEIFEETREVASQTGLQLLLPEIAPREQRRCDFVEQGGAFISWDGKVHPCYYLWHHCRSYAAGWQHPVQPRVFGSLCDKGLLEIWNSSAFRAYRENVLRFDYPFCPGCNFAPCDYVQAEDFAQDCYVNAEPCGSCLWSAGLFQCMR